MRKLSKEEIDRRIHLLMERSAQIRRRLDDGSDRLAIDLKENEAILKETTELLTQLSLYLRESNHVDRGQETIRQSTKFA
jgi:hypothetical protein